MDKQINSYNMTILKNIYNIQKYKPTQTKSFEVSCIYNISNFYNFEMLVNKKKSYLSIILPLGELNLLWTFLEKLSNNIYDSINMELEGPEQFLYAFKTNDNNLIRLIHISNGWFANIRNKNNQLIEVQQVLSADKYIVHFDIIINKKQFILAFYKELFTMFYDKQIRKYDEVGQKIITESKILREYFQEMGNDDLLALKNRNSINVPNIKF